MKTKNIIYLNKKTHDDIEYCVLYFTKDDEILKCIKQNSWIVWHPEFKGYAVIEKSNTFGLLLDLFRDIAYINKKYYHAQLKGNTDETIIGDTLYFKGILQPKKKIGTIMLVPYKKDGDKLLLIKYKYSRSVNGLLVKNSYTKWNSTLKFFTLKPNVRLINLFVESISNELN